MNTIFTTGLLACAVASTLLVAGTEAAPGQMIRIGVNVDYSWVAMDQVNNELNRGDNVTEMHSGLAGMLNLDLFLTPFLSVGARAGYLHCLPLGRARYNYVLYSQETTLNAALVPLEAGLCLNIGPPAGPISIIGGFYCGYGFAFASYKNDVRALGQTAAYTLPYKGGGFSGEALAGVNFKLSSAVLVNIKAGYRIAKIPRMKQSQDVSFDGISGVTIEVGEKGDILKDSDNDNLAFDYSGFNIGAGLSLGF